MTGSHDNIIFSYARGGSNRGKAKNKTTTWGAFKLDLSNPHRTAERFVDYLSASTDEQNILKSSAGYFFGAPLRDGLRKRHHALARRIITIDADTLTPQTVSSLRDGSHPLCEYEFIAFPTRKNQLRAPRYRIIILCEHAISEEDYRNLCTLVCLILDPTLDQIDDISFRPVQLMYWPTLASDQPYEIIENPGLLLDAQGYAQQWGIEQHGDADAWRDYSLIPASNRQGKRRLSQAKAQVPTEKHGVVGAFCRAYDVEAAIEHFLPDVYSPVEGDWGKPRYTFVRGSGSGGVEVQDGGLFIYSHHQSDPCGDQLCNAFDMVRLHLFGDRDAGLPDEAKTNPTKVPSFQAMVGLCTSDSAVLAQYGSVDPDEALRDEDVAPDADPQAFSDVPLRSSSVDSDLMELVNGPPEPPTMLQRMNARHAVAVVGGDTVIINTSRNDITYSAESDLRLLYRNKKMPSKSGGEYTRADWWLEQKDRLTYLNGVTFSPGKEVKGAYNLWRGWAIQPKEGSCALFLEHLRRIVCVNDVFLYKWLLGYLAHMVQKPWEKPGVAIVLKGLKGAGKDAVGEYIGKLIGKHRVKIAQMEQLTGKFNRQLEHALLVHVEEAFWAGDMRAAGPLKNIITAETIRIEPKGVDSTEIASVLRLLMTTNEEWAVPASGDERRYAVFDVSDELVVLRRNPTTQAAARAYFNAFFHERDNGGAAALLHMLMRHPIGDVDVRGPPRTLGLDNQKVASLRNLPAWWFEILSFGNMPFAEGDWSKTSPVVSTPELYGSYVAWLGEHRYHGSPINPTWFGRDLRKMVAATKHRLRSDHDRPWGLKFPNLQTCRLNFDQWLTANLPWDDENLDEDLIEYV